MLPGSAPEGESGLRLRDETLPVYGPDHDERRRPAVSHLQNRRAGSGEKLREVLRRASVLRSDAPAPGVDSVQVSRTTPPAVTHINPAWPHSQKKILTKKVTILHILDVK